MKKVTFYGYVEGCTCKHCRDLKTIMQHEETLHINSFRIEDCDSVSVADKVMEAKK